MNDQLCSDDPAHLSILQLAGGAVSCANHEWSSVIEDVRQPGAFEDASDDGPHDARRITEYHRDIGADWTIDGRYRPGEDFWCGVFAGFCWNRAADHLQGDFVDAVSDIRLKEPVGTYFFPSTTRLAGRWRPWSNYDLPAPMVIDPAHIRKGDLLLVYTGRTDREWGDHVCLARGAPTGAEGQMVPTYEGNATGRLGDGTNGEGVIANQQHFADIATVFRLRPRHFRVPEGIELVGGVNH